MAAKRGLVPAPPGCSPATALAQIPISGNARYRGAVTRTRTDQYFIRLPAPAILNPPDPLTCKSASISVGPPIIIILPVDRQIHCARLATPDEQSGVLSFFMAVAQAPGQ